MILWLQSYQVERKKSSWQDFFDALEDTVPVRLPLLMLLRKQIHILCSKESSDRLLDPLHEFWLILLKTMAELSMHIAQGWQVHCTKNEVFH